MNKVKLVLTHKKTMFRLCYKIKKKKKKTSYPSASFIMAAVIIIILLFLLSRFVSDSWIELRNAYDP